MLLLLIFAACIPDFPVQNFPPIIEEIRPEDGSVVNEQENTLFSILISAFINSASLNCLQTNIVHGTIINCAVFLV